MDEMILTENQIRLASTIRAQIYKHYTPQVILEEFNVKIKGHVKNMAKNILTDAEINERSERAANGIAGQLNRIDNESVISKMSDKVQDAILYRGETIVQHADYFKKFCKALVGMVIAGSYKQAKKEIKKHQQSQKLKQPKKKR